MGLFLSSLLILVNTGVFFQTEAGWKPGIVSTGSEERHLDARKHGMRKKELFLQRTASYHLVRGSENTILLTQLSILNFPKLPVKDGVSSDDTNFLFSCHVKMCFISRI